MKIDNTKKVDLDLSTLGGKGYYTSLLQKNNIRTPNGFVLSHDVLANVDSHIDEIITNFNKLSCKYVSVRSSASNEDSGSESLAGFYKTFLYVDGDGLIDRVKECYSFHLSSENKKNKFSILVQEMITSKISGVCFTANPLTGEKEYIVESAYGLCEGVVSGKVTPSRYIIDKDRNISKNIKTQGLLCVYDEKYRKVIYKRLDEKEYADIEGEKLDKLIVLSGSIEKILGCPSDIEWCIDEDNELCILQARPISSINNKDVIDNNNYSVKYRETDSIWRQDLGFRSKVESPYEFTIFRNIVRYSTGGDFITLISDIDRDNTEKYANDLFYDKGKINYIFSSIKKINEKYNEWFNQWFLFEFSELNLDEISDVIKGVISINLETKRFYEITGTNYTTQYLRRLQDNLGDDFSLLIEPFDFDLIDIELMDWYKLYEECGGKFYKNKLTSHLYEYPWLCSGVSSASDIEHYLSDRWDYTRIELDSSTVTIQEIIKKKIEERDSRNHQKIEIINNKYNHLEDDIHLAHELSLSRMNMKKYWAGSSLFMVSVIYEIAKRKNLSTDDIFNSYTCYDMLKLINEGVYLSEKDIDERSVCVLWYANTFYQGNDALEIIKRINIASDSDLKGDSAFPGNVTGLAYLWTAYDEYNFSRIKSDSLDIEEGNYIFICSMAQPSITQYLSKFKAIITEEGGILSHAAIISREQKKPCIVGVNGIMEKVKHLHKVSIYSDGSVVID